MEFMKSYGKDPQDPSQRKIAYNITKDVSKIQKIVELDFIRRILDCFRGSNREKILKRANLKVEKELDIQKFILR